jgi:hypothetical protein
MLLGMDDWHHRLVGELVKDSPAGMAPDAATALEVAFGHARSALTYALELARAHRIPATGYVAGDSIWMQLADQRIRFTLNRREGHVLVLRPGEDEAAVARDADLGKLARDAIDGLVAAWRALPADARRPSGPPREEDDEPTKG